MRIVVTGGAGFIGSHLCELLLERGEEIICLDNMFTSRRENIAHLAQHRNFEFHRHDVCDPWHIECDQIYHLACPASPVHYQRNPVRTLETAMLGTRNALNCARSTGARLLITSTSEVYGDPEEHPQKESYVGHVNMLGPRACYDEGKRVGESLAMSWALQYGTDVRIARLFNTYGPRMAFGDGRLIPNFILQAIRCETLTVYGSGEQTRSFCYVSDTVGGIVKLMEAHRGLGESEVPVVNIGNPDERTIVSVARDVIAAFQGGPAGIVNKPLPADDPKQRCPDITRAKQLLGWKPEVSYEDGIARTIEWFKSEFATSKSASTALSVAPTSASTPSPAPTPAPVARKKLAFLFSPWACTHAMDPDALFTSSRGLTGSEVSCVMQAIEMSKSGWSVTVYSNFTKSARVGGVEFAPWDRWANEAKRNFHTVIAMIDPAGLQDAGRATRIFNQQVNDFGYCDGWESYVDVAVSPSEPHIRHLKNFTTFQNWRVVPNGCDPGIYEDVPRGNKKLVYASSPDRGLHWLLELFPTLKKRFSDVECHVYYNFDEGHADAYASRGEHEMAKRFRYVALAVKKLQGHGVFHHRSVSRHEMAKVLSSARLLAYPCDPVRYTEGFSCTTLEAAAAGCLPVLCGADALGEIYADYVPMVPAPYRDHKIAYGDLLEKYLRDDGAYEVARRKARQLGKVYDWTEVGRRLQSVIGRA